MSPGAANGQAPVSSSTDMDPGNILLLLRDADVPAGDEASVPLPDQHTAWSVRKEAACGDGYIDLLLESAHYGIAIENKIWADEQDRQLARYGDYLVGKYVRPTDQHAIIYLTLDGKAATTHEDHHYLRISYRKHILAWLERCLQATYDIPPVNQVLIQYRQVVRELTGQPLEADAMNELADFLTQHPEIIRARPSLNAAVDQIRSSMLDRLAQAITKDLSRDFTVTERPNMIPGGFGTDENGGLVIAPPPDSPLTNLPGEIWIEHVSRWEGLVIGIESAYGKPEPSEEDQRLLNKMDEFLTLHAEETGYHKGEVYKSPWKGPYWPTTWHNLIYPFSVTNDAYLVEMLDPAVFSERTQGVCAEARHHIKLLEETYTKARAEMAAES
jgi:hypothetical protein